MKKQPEAKGEKKKETDHPSWIGTPPCIGDCKVKTVDRATYYWCKYHAKRSLNPKHTSTSCTAHGLTRESKLLFNNDHVGEETPQLPIAGALSNTLPHEDEMDSQE